MLAHQLPLSLLSLPMSLCREDADQYRSYNYRYNTSEACREELPRLIYRDCESMRGNRILPHVHSLTLRKHARFKEW